MERRNECKAIEIRKLNWGLDLSYNLDLDCITIKISNFYIKQNKEYDFKIIRKKLQQEIIFDPNIVIKSRGLKKSFKANIDNKTFNRIFKNIENINFGKLYEENGSGYDGWELEFTLNKIDGLLKYTKKIQLFSPYKNNSNFETNKLLDIFEELKILSKYSEYYEKIEKKRRIFLDQKS